jgi:serine/threonine protein kinase
MKKWTLVSSPHAVFQGLTFIHESEIHFHGRLKSSNCLIDSRWVLKVTDFGLAHFRTGEDRKELGEHAFYQSKSKENIILFELSLRVMRKRWKWIS